MNASQLRQQTDELLRNGKYDGIKALLLSYKDITEKDNDLATVCYLCTIYEQESAAGQAGIFSKVSCMEDLLDRYTRLKFCLRRIEFGITQDLEPFYRFLTQNQVSSCELLRVIDFSVVDKRKIFAVMNEYLSAHASADRGRTNGAEGQELPAADAADEVQSAEMYAETAIYDGESGIIHDGDMDTQEICFIICTNHPMYAEECACYINHLIVPDGYHIDILTVEEARSMTSGYNEAMQYSRAKYKVYLHHDTFIVCPHFIEELLRIFRSDETIGMIGVIGAPRIPENGIMWDEKRYGMIYEQHIYETVMLSNPCTRPLEEVEAIDGLLMATQYDIPWREDLFDKWDFYDCSQSMEFIRQGYKVVVPKTELPWCVHDCGFLNMENYEEERQKFVVEYLLDKRNREETV